MKKTEKKLSVSDAEKRREKAFKSALGFAFTKEEAENICSMLTKRFGSLGEVFSSGDEGIESIPEISSKTARFVKDIITLSKLDSLEKSEEIKRIFDTFSAADAMRPKFEKAAAECVCLLVLDGEHHVVFNDVICTGGFGEVPLHMRDIVKICTEYPAEEVYIAHNHPSGNSAPSRNDLIATDRIITALSCLNIELADHLIFSGDSSFSFSEAGLLENQNRIVNRAQTEQTKEVQALESLIIGSR